MWQVYLRLWQQNGFTTRKRTRICILPKDLRRITPRVKLQENTKIKRVPDSNSEYRIHFCKISSEGIEKNHLMKSDVCRLVVLKRRQHARSVDETVNFPD
jgi:hypothetical protein